IPAGCRSPTSHRTTRVRALGSGTDHLPPAAGRRGRATIAPYTARGHHADDVRVPPGGLAAGAQACGSEGGGDQIVIAPRAAVIGLALLLPSAAAFADSSARGRDATGALLIGPATTAPSTVATTTPAYDRKGRRDPFQRIEPPPP